MINEKLRLYADDQSFITINQILPPEDFESWLLAGLILVLLAIAVVPTISATFATQDTRFWNPLGPGGGGEFAIAGGVSEDTYTFGKLANTPPVAAGDSYYTNVDTTLTVTAPGVLNNDSDADLDPITAVLYLPPTSGSLAFQPDGSFIYTPTLSFTGLVTYTYVVSDGLDLSNAATVSITVSSPTFSQTKIITDSSSMAGDQFGFLVSLSGDTAVIGAPFQDGVVGTNSGAVYVHERNQGGANNWGLVKELTASDAASHDVFGFAVSISGDTAVVGAWLDDDSGSASGSAYVFERDQGGPDNWGEVKKLTASDGSGLDFFGWYVSISGDTIAIGARQDDDSGSASGSVYLYQRDQGGANNWGEVKKLTASDGDAGDEFGTMVSIVGNLLVVGAPLNDDAGGDSGSAYIFERDQGGVNNWGEVKKLTASDATGGDQFGYSVAASGSSVVIGAINGDGNVLDSGSAYVFDRDQGGANNWGQVKKLFAIDGAGGDLFSHSVYFSGNRVVVGAIHNAGAAADSGSVYVFERDLGGLDSWGQLTKLTATDGGTDSQFGNSAAMAGKYILVGARHHDVGGNDRQGSAYIFENLTPIPTALSLLHLNGRLAGFNMMGFILAAVLLTAVTLLRLRGLPQTKDD